jgi:hypothetical protein
MSDPELRDPRLDEAYRRLPGDEPPPELDERIRAAARRAVGARPQSLGAHRSWVTRWRVPLSLAASVMIVVTLTLMMQEEDQRVLYSDPASAPPAPATLEDRAVPRAAEEAKRQDTEGASAKPVAPAPKAPAAAQRAPAADAAAPPPAELQKLETRQQRREESPLASPPPAPPAGIVAPAPAPEPAAKALVAPPAAAPSGASDSLSRERGVGERPARALRSAPQAARSPEEWIEEIRRLKAQGRDADAATELAEFRRRHPDYVLPADLAR